MGLEGIINGVNRAKSAGAAGGLLTKGVNLVTEALTSEEKRKLQETFSFANNVGQIPTSMGHDLGACSN